MKRKNILAVGLSGALMMTTVAGTSVFAAENAMDGTGATSVTWKPGSSTGGDGDGNVSSWTIDYPVKTVLDDATVTADSGRKLTFDAVNTGSDNSYTGAAQIKVSLALNANRHGYYNITMLDGDDSTADEVRMRITRSTGSTIGGSGDINTNLETHFATLSSDNPSASVSAWLFNKDKAKTGKSYHTTLTWKFHSDRVTN
nr:hypothetical protein [uncultured Mediterraneibacter sp.]